MTPSDLDDCLAYLRFSQKQKEPFSPREILRFLDKIEKSLAGEGNADKATRLETLRQALKRLKS